MEGKGTIVNPLKEDIRSRVSKIPNINDICFITPIQKEKRGPRPRLRYPFTKYAKAHGIKLPEFGLPIREGEASRKSRLRGSERASIPAKLTKQPEEMFSRESSARDSKISDRLSLEIDMKISHVNRSFSDFEKKYRSVNENIQDAVRRSAADSLRNRSLVSSPIFSEDRESGKCVDKYLKELEKETAGSKFVAEVTSPRSCPKMFGLDPLAVLEGSDNSSGDSDSDSSYRKAQYALPGSKSGSAQGNYQEDLEDAPSALNSIMSNLSDKAFLTKLKKREGQTNKSIQQMKTQLSAVHQRVEIDRRKANLQENKSKSLYNPRNKEVLRTKLQGFNAIKGPRKDLTDFVQSSGGKTGSWKPEDHARFLKAHNQWKDEPSKLIETIMQQVKTKSAKEVMAHVKWYEEYDSLSQANKDELRNWDMKTRPGREMSYQMVSEGQKSKLENDKRRQNHMKAKRVEERQRSRAMLTEWKKSKTLEEPAEPRSTDMQDIQKEMLDLADKIQSISFPGKKKFKPPTKYSNSATAKRTSGNPLPDVITESEEAQYNDHLKKCREREGLPARNDSSSTEMPKVDDKSQVQKNKSMQSNSANSSLRKSKDGIKKGSKNVLPAQKIPGNGNSKLIQGSPALETVLGSLESAVPSMQPETVPIKPSKLTNETHSHRVKRENQRYKRLEIQSQRARVPNRMEDSNMWEASTALLALQSKKATPSWRK